MENNIGDKLQPCATPCSTLIVADYSPSKSTDTSYFLVEKTIIEESALYIQYTVIEKSTETQNFMLHKFFGEKFKYEK